MLPMPGKIQFLIFPQFIKIHLIYIIKQVFLLPFDSYVSEIIILVHHLWHVILNLQLIHKFIFFHCNQIICKHLSIYSPVCAVRIFSSCFFLIHQIFKHLVPNLSIFSNGISFIILISLIWHKYKDFVNDLQIIFWILIFYFGLCWIYMYTHINYLYMWNIFEVFFLVHLICSWSDALTHISFS